MPTQAKQTEISLNFGERELVLVGTAHVSELSVQEVSEAVETMRPDTVALELDDKRLANLENPDAWREMDIVKVLREKNGFLMLANVVLSSFQKRMGAPMGVKPGDEMLAALNAARSRGIRCEMVDRPISVTLRRAWMKSSFMGKCSLLAVLLASAFSHEEVSPEQIEQLKHGSEMDSLMAELSDTLPAIKEVLIDERNRYLAARIWACPGSKVLAVLGAGHLPGVKEHLEKIAAGSEGTDCSDIESVPDKTVPARLAGWIIPALIVALIVAGFVIGGAQRGWNMLGAWVFSNGLLAAVGALLAGGHPLAVLVSFAGAPFTSLCPFIGIGVVSGIVQAIVCKPKVADMETLQEDAASLRGFYRNRILRTLLVFFLSSLGSSVGTFVAGARFVTVIASFFNKVVALFRR